MPVHLVINLNGVRRNRCQTLAQAICNVCEFVLEHHLPGEQLIHRVLLLP
jgi:hypothetical protein